MPMRNAGFMVNNNVMDLLLDAICVVSREGRFVGVSPACERIFGYSPEELIGRAMIELVFPDDRERTLQAARDIMAGVDMLCFENRYVHKDGRIVHILWSARWSEVDHVRVAVAHDITERKRSELRQAATFAISEATHAAQDLAGLLQRIHQIIAELIPGSDFAVVLQNEDANSLRVAYPLTVQGASSTVLDFARQVIHGTLDFVEAGGLVSPQDGDAPVWLGVPLNAGQDGLGALILHGTSEVRYTDQDKQLLHYVATQLATFIERQRMLSRLQFMAQFDQLTGLPNRALLFDRLHIALARAKREQTQLSLLFLDLDKFKQVNDSLGHKAGDQLLQMVAQRLLGCIRESDTAARLAGDEFVVLLEDAGAAEGIAGVAEKIRFTLSQPFELEGLAHFVLPSIGGAVYPQHGSEAQQLLQRADHAMYQAKRAGGNRFQLAHDSDLSMML